jgi:hypothetical protein
MLLLLVDSDFTTHVGEFVAVVLMSATGGLLIAAAQDLLVIFIGLELLESRSLHPHRVSQRALSEERRSRDEVLPVWRNVGGVSAVWLQLLLRVDVAARSLSSGFEAVIATDRAEPAVLCRMDFGCCWPGIQSCGGPISLVGAGYAYEGAPSAPQRRLSHPFRRLPALRCS